FDLDLWFAGLTRNRTMQFVVLAAIANLAGAVSIQLWAVGTLPDDAIDVVTAMFVVSFLFLAAALAHPGAHETITRMAAGSPGIDAPRARLVVVAAALIAPAAIIAAVAPTSSLDITVRVVGMVLAVSAVMTRLWIATAEASRTQTTLVQNMNHDELTGLPNRSRFVECVSDRLEQTWRTEQRPMIIQLNIDRFKNINDSLGHSDANRVLVEVGRRLANSVGSFGGVVARVGGDDFVIVDTTTRSTGDAMERVDGIRRAFTQPVQVGESLVFVTASIGVALAPRHRSVTAEDLLRRADIATHRAKADGRNRVVLFDDSMQAHLTRRMDVEHALHGAIGRQEMRLYHQPIVDIVTGRVSGFEALIRWQRADGTLVPPGDFIAIAEETGIICEIGAWALNDALSRLRGWIDDGVVSATTTMSVNVSPRQIADPSFAAIVSDAIERSGVSAHLLWLEMTESMMLDEPELAKATLREIRSMGVRLALDDFGTGFSSLSLLQQFPIQRIKIDRAFVRGIAERSNDRSLVRTIIAMAQSMGLDMVAEGVETVHQLQSLRELGCDKAQGFLISHPVPPDAMRSTMAALDELASLSLFGPAEPDFAAVSTRSGLQGRPDVPVRRDRSGPLLSDVRRPLGRSIS
ncbi:MAG: bifunctional diguanylate cyclase/phosphodiesterase, partial [Ilumatobacteraceae bacterium]